LAPILKEIKLAHLLYIEGSPRKARSASIEVAAAALAAWRVADSTLTVDTRISMIQ
jgi:FMN-dependent NADH-azoreductase